MGSATPKKKRPVLTPQEKSIVNHVASLYSGTLSACKTEFGIRQAHCPPARQYSVLGRHTVHLRDSIRY